MKKNNLFRNVLLVTFLMFITGSLSGQVSDTVRYDQYGNKVTRTPLAAEARNGVLVFESADQKYRFWFDARVQVDGGYFFGETYNPIGNGVSIRRARLAAKTSFGNGWYGEIDMDLSNSELELKDAYLEKTWNDIFRLRAGNFKEGFSMETTTTSRYLTFIERANATYTFGPSRHIGTAAIYSNKSFFIMGGVHFQTVGGLEERIFSEDNNKDFGVDEGYSLTGKLVFKPLYASENSALHFGVAGSYRTPKSDGEIRGSLRYSTRSLSSINRKKYMDTDLMGGVDHATLTGLEFAAYKNQFRFQAEYFGSSVAFEDGSPTQNFNGFYAFGSWLLFGGQHNYDNEDAEFTQPSRGKDWGDIELALRYDYLNLNSDMDGVMGGAGEGYTFGLNYHVNNNVKIMLNYVYMNHDRYASGKNKYYVGYDLDGNLTRNPKNVADAAGKAGEDYNMLLVRFEIDF